MASNKHVKADRSRVLAIAAVLVILTGVVKSADACSCFPAGPPCQNYFAVDAVFVGTVQTIRPIEQPRDSGPPIVSRSVAFTVERAYRAVQGATVEVETGMGGGDCGYPFKPGGRYLVYAYRTKGRAPLATGICTRTRAIAEAADDLQFIERLPAVGRGARVYGAVIHWEGNFVSGTPVRYPPVPFAHVRLRGPSLTREAETGEAGQYEIADVPPGNYELQVIPPATFSSRYAPTTIEVRDPRGCVPQDFGVHFDNRISGVVFDRDGQPVGGVVVEAMPVELAGSSRFVNWPTVATDSGGYFEFREVPPGQYVVGVSIRRATEPDILYPRTYYPGTPAVSEAARISMAEGNHEQLGPLRLPPARQTRELSGVVVSRDGRPLAGAAVSLMDGEARWRQVAAGIQTDGDGGFKFVVHDGLSYIVQAMCNVPNDPAHRQIRASAGPFVVSPQLVPLRLALAVVPDQ
jgi:uncharacterized GH25 family protein